MITDSRFSLVPGSQLIDPVWLPEYDNQNIYLLLAEYII